MTTASEQQLAKEHRAYWDKGADIYDGIIHNEFTNGAYEKWELIISRLLKDKKGLKVLDVGTGPCFFGILLSRLGHNVTAIDSSPEMITKAKKNAAHFGCPIQIIETDIFEFNPVEPFDLIISRNVTWFLTNPVRAYRNWHSWLNEGGDVIIFDGNWNLFLTDPKEAFLQKLAQQEAVEQGYIPYRTEDEIAEGHEFALALPLSYVKRPMWDVDMLKHIGFTQVQVWQGFDADIQSHAEQVLNQHKPMFAITATK
jgi:SAM-dependent methyltransferase